MEHLVFKKKAFVGLLYRPPFGLPLKSTTGHAEQLLEKFVKRHIFSNLRRHVLVNRGDYMTFIVYVTCIP